MKTFSPLTIAMTAIAVSFVWSFAQMPVQPEQVSFPLPVMAKAAGTSSVSD